RPSRCDGRHRSVAGCVQGGGAASAALPRRARRCRSDTRARGRLRAGAGDRRCPTARRRHPRRPERPCRLSPSPPEARGPHRLERHRPGRARTRRGAAWGREACLMEIWFHLANVLYVVSYLVTDILWLRALAVLGGLSSLTWTLTTPTPNATFIGWTLVYNTINVVQIARLWHERRPVRLGHEEQALYAAAFRTLTPREFLRLLAVGRWQVAS